MNKYAAFFASAVFAGLSFLGPDAGSGAQTLVYQGNPQMHATTPATIEFFDVIREKTGGGLDIQFAGMGSVVKAEASFSAVRDGILDMGMFSPNDAIAALPLSNAAGFPWLVKDAAHGARLEKALLKALPEMKAELDKQVRLLAFWTSDRNCILSLHSAVRVPADLAGKRVLTWTPGLVDEIKAWGGIPVSIGSSDAYVGLQRGMGEAVYCQLPMAKALKLYEVAKFATPIAPSAVMPLAAGMNLDVWDALTPDEQAVVTEVLADWGRKMGDVTKADGDETIRVMKESGCRVVELSGTETGAFKALSLPVQREFWIRMLTNARIQDPAAYIDRVTAIASGVE